MLEPLNVGMVINKIKSISCLLYLIILSHLYVCAQGGFVKPLNIGDGIPLKNFQSYPNLTKEINLDSLRGKLIILDFWDVTCSSCIEHMPDLERIQKLHDSKVEIILVTKDSQEKVRELSKRVRILRDVKLPMVNTDTILSRLFPYQTVPYHVWIDSNMMVVQETYGQNTTEEAVTNYLLGKKVLLPIHMEQVDYEKSEPIWEGANMNQWKYVQFYSLITSHIDFGGSGFKSKRDSITGKLLWLKAYNVPIFRFFQLIYAKDNTSPFRLYNRIVMDVKNKSLYVPPLNISRFNEWANTNTFCYEIQVPASKSDHLKEYLKQDIERYFYLSSGIEKRKVLCLVLTRISKRDYIRTHGGLSTTRTEDSGDYLIRNMPLATSLIISLQNANQFGAFPILNGTNYNSNIDLIIHSKLNDLSNTRKELRKVGLDLVKKYKYIDMLLLKNKKESFE